MKKPKIYNPPIAMAKEYWLNGIFSAARHYGGMMLNGNQYCIVNRYGKPYWGAIVPTEPADLVIVDWIPLYRKVGRERFIEIVKKTNDLTEAKRMAEEEI